MTLFTRLTIFMFARRLVPRTHKMRIAVPPPAASTLRRSPTLAGFREIKKLFSAVCIENHRAYGDFQHRVFARSSVAVRPFTMSAVTMCGTPAPAMTMRSGDRTPPPTPDT